MTEIYDAGSHILIKSGYGDPDKKAYYVKATEMFYDYYADYFESGRVSRYEVPYEDVKLPVMVA